MRHRDRTLRRYSAIEEAADGSETMIKDRVDWRQDNDDVTLVLRTGDLESTQSVTISWEANDA